MPRLSRCRARPGDTGEGAEARSPRCLRKLKQRRGLVPLPETLAEAEPLLARALEIREKALGTDHASVANVLDTVGNLYHDQGRLADAERIYQRALQIREKALGLDHPLTKATREALDALNAEKER